MQAFTFLAIAVAGVVILRRIHRTHHVRLQELLRETELNSQRANVLASELHREFHAAAQSLEAALRGTERRTVQLFQIAECAVYTRRTVKTLFDPISEASLTVAADEKILRIGREIEPWEFKALLKAKSRASRFEGSPFQLLPDQCYGTQLRGVGRTMSFQDRVSDPSEWAPMVPMIPDVTEDELDRREQSGEKRYSTAEVLARVEKL